MKTANRIIVNTAVSYMALLCRMIVGLFSVRLILQALGEVDYGVFVIVAGIVAVLDILNSNMSNTSMRFLAYSLGKNEDEIITTFNSTLVIHYFIGIMTIIALEIGGWIMFDYIVNIPPDRMNDAKIVYQFMVVSTFITVISVPYDAVTNAHEKIWMLSLFDILDLCLILLMALSLSLFENHRLIIYAFSLMMIKIVMRFIKVIYAKRKFEECCRFKIKMVSFSRIKEILSYTGWNLFASVAALGAGQFRSIILNYFFGVKLNAAEGVSRQVSKPINMMVSSMTRAINPQIMKSEGGNNRNRMRYIVAMGAKYSTFLFALFGIPVILEADFLLRIWLGHVPEYAVIFCRISIICMLLEKFTFQITHAINAVGKIRNFQVSIAIGNLIYLPISFVFFKMGYQPVTIYYLSMFSMLFNALIRFYYGKTVAGINPLDFIKTAILPVLYPLLIAFVISFALYYIIEDGWFNLILLSIVYGSGFFLLFYLIGMDEDERNRWKTIIFQIKNKIAHIK